MATDRLRRRLRDVDPKELSTLSDNFCIIGTPLPDLLAKKDANELKPIWQQEARDAQGRRRFHGAFTGGFSAGYFNTVGSEAGWTPSSFRSSRKDKHAGSQAAASIPSRPEDFMDEEDLQDRKAAQTITTNQGFGLQANSDGLIAGLRATDSTGSFASDPLLSSLGIGSNESLGSKLLRRMGWKDGQGLGPRVDAQKKARLENLVSTVPASSIATSSAVTLEDLKHLYAPPPTPMLSPAASRSGRSGLGYEDKPSLNRALGAKAGVSTNEENRSIGKSREEVWPDGRNVLAGFRLASQAVPPAPVFAALHVPPDWQPDPSRVWHRFTAADAKAPTGAAATTASAASRGQLLGEAKMPGPPPNVAAFLSAKARERLALDPSVSLPSGAVASFTAAPAAPEQVQVPRLDVATAKLALQGFAPFGTDPEKQERYLSFLRSQLEASSEQACRLAVPAHMTAEQFSNELRDFAKSAAVFRPMSSAIASRFTTASAAVMAHETKATTATPGLRHPAPAAAADPSAEDKPEEREEEELSVAQKAARMGNFGHLTRSVEAWAPARLLCKRFGVPEPATTRKRRSDEEAGSSSKAARLGDEEVDPFYGSTPSSKARSGLRADQHWERSKEQLKALAAVPTPLSIDAMSAAGSAQEDNMADADATEQIGMGEDERQGRDTLTYVKPSMDVYKAIFESDEEQDAEESKPTRSAAVPKMQDPASGSGVVFQARAKNRAQDAHDKGNPPPIKRKKSKAPKKSLLTFDLDDGDAEGGDQQRTESTAGKARLKGRTRAADLFE
ncbi:g-patch domain [Moesziomyces antarcticus]|uniref:G-patch domain-containing protein n=1 Tax=Pseudozyma antarctica TaxID=84753 RepID=A0A5C3FJ87_PSEA2|nr:g-patch domain [Moesziomyces antarcticus]GAK62940.1 g-patch domain [Moesziomyces antarcticus]SPO43581.1 uncharacterized protein PSANT_01266 [Moesziomyces antarcticus]